MSAFLLKQDRLTIAGLKTTAVDLATITGRGWFVGTHATCQLRAHRLKAQSANVLTPNSEGLQTQLANAQIRVGIRRPQVAVTGRKRAARRRQRYLAG